MAKEKKLKKAAANRINNPRLNVNRIAYLALREQGHGQRAASEKLGLGHSYGYMVEKKLGKKYTLADAGLAKRSYRVIKAILDGTPRDEEKTAINREGEVVNYTSKIYPSFGNQLTAAELVQDRYDPPTPSVPPTQVNLAVILQEAHNALRADGDVTTPSGEGSSDGSGDGGGGGG